jgi:biotin carboxyl carrier protein
MKYIVTINNKNYEVEVEKGQASIVKTTEAAVPNIKVVTQPAAPVQNPAPQAPVTVVASKGEAVKAPMPGSIINVKVTEGQRVKKGEVILILEAMKMENEITAPVDGVVVQIVVDKGASVATGDLLAVIQ